MLIADSQVHLWAADSPQRPWPPGRAAEAQKPYPISKETLLFQMDLAGVQPHGARAAVLGGRPQRPRARGRARVSRSLRGHGPAGAWAIRPAARWWPTGASSRACSACASPSTTSTTATSSPTAPADWLWPAAEKAGVPLMVLVPGALDHLDRIAGKHPGLKLVIDHVGLNVRGKGPKVFEDLPAVCALAKHPNVAVKASGMPSLSTEPLSVPRPARRTSARWSTPSARSACSGAPTSRACRAPTTSASRSSPSTCPG